MQNCFVVEVLEAVDVQVVDLLEVFPEVKAGADRVGLGAKAYRAVGLVDFPVVVLGLILAPVCQFSRLEVLHQVQGVCPRDGAMV